MFGLVVAEKEDPQQQLGADLDGRCTAAGGLDAVVALTLLGGGGMDFGAGGFEKGMRMDDLLFGTDVGDRAWLLSLMAALALSCSA